MTDEIEGADDKDWIYHAGGLETDLTDFEAYIWPVFREHGFEKSTAVLCWYLNMLTLSVNKLITTDEEDDGKFDS